MSKRINFDVKMIDPDTHIILHKFIDQYHARDYIWDHKEKFNCNVKNKNDIIKNISLCIAKNQNNKKSTFYGYIWISDVILKLKSAPKNYRVYKIINKITNECVYCGQTSFPVNLRFDQHKADYRRGKCCPLLTKIFDKYGIDNFKVEIIEDNINKNKINELEEYYIYEKIIQLIKNNKDILNLGCTAIAKIIGGGVNPRTIKKVCIKNGYELPNLSPFELRKKHLSKKIVAKNKNTNVEMCFYNQYLAAEWIKENKKLKSSIYSITSNIIQCLNKKIEFIYGYYWKLII